MTDAEIKKRLYVKIDLLGLGAEQDRFAKWVANCLALEVAKIVREAEKK